MRRTLQRTAPPALLLLLLGLIPAAGQIVSNVTFEREDGETRIGAAEWFFQQRAYPSSAIPRGYRFAALAELERSGRRWSRRLALQTGATGRWIELGPDNVGGRTLALAIHPNNDDIVYAGLADGGVFKTTDGG